MRVAILANGDTFSNFATNHVSKPYDRVWGLNQQAAIKNMQLDRCFVMDDLKLRMPYYAGHEFTEWLKSYRLPIITSREYPEWPTAVAYPIKEICHYFGLPLGVSMYSTPDYMIALAIYEGATHIALYGVDMTSKSVPPEMTDATAQWIGAAEARGVMVRTFQGSRYQGITNIGICMEAGLYGYAQRPRIEDLVNPEYYEEWKDAFSSVA
jgi:hypothetical protein